VPSRPGQLTALLTFDDVGLNDVGTYTCVVNNTAGRVSHDVLVTGQQVKSCTVLSPPQACMHGRDVVIVCGKRYGRSMWTGSMAGGTVSF
jgi:Immunoglobulin domain